MIPVVIRGNWAPYVGTDYCHALGVYPSISDNACLEDAHLFAQETWEGPEEGEEEDGIMSEGPEYWVEAYDPDTHDMLRGGGGSFEEDFAKMGWEG